MSMIAYAQDFYFQISAIDGVPSGRWSEKRFQSMKKHIFEASAHVSLAMDSGIAER